jgi:hypothetical protein
MNGLSSTTNTDRSFSGRVGLVCATLLLAASGSLQAEPIFTLDPANGALQGAPGETVGWGFRMISDPANWTTVVGTLLLGESNPGLGIYTDFITGQGGPTFGSLPAGAVDWVQPFTVIPGSGFASYLIDPSALPGSTNAGSILILYEMYSNNPATCGGACFVSSGAEMLDFSVQVSGVPEPGTVTMLALGGAALLVAGWRRRQRV